MKPLCSKSNLYHSTCALSALVKFSTFCLLLHLTLPTHMRLAFHLSRQELVTSTDDYASPRYHWPSARRPRRLTGNSASWHRRHFHHVAVRRTAMVRACASAALSFGGVWHHPPRPVWQSWFLFGNCKIHLLACYIAQCSLLAPFSARSHEREGFVY
jgi:hypothetical protein